MNEMHSPTEIIVLVLGLYGGLTNILSSVVPVVVKLFMPAREEDFKYPTGRAPPPHDVQQHRIRAAHEIDMQDVAQRKQQQQQQQPPKQHGHEVAAALS